MSSCLLEAIKRETESGIKMSDETKSIMEKLEKLDGKTTSIQLTLENETNRNIQIIAEGHLDLGRKLNDALKIENELRIVF